MKNKFVIIDDEADFRDAVYEHLPPEVQKSYEFSRLGNEKFREQIEYLERRREIERGNSDDPEPESIFDSAAYVVIDYDLIDYGVGSYFTGEDLAYLIRCFSTASVIITLNTNSNSPKFNLNLQPSLLSFANVSVSAADLENEKFWAGPSDMFYRPWIWPNLENLPANFDQRCEDVSASLDTGLLEFLQFGGFWEKIDQRYSSLLGENLDRLTLREFAKNSSLGVRGKDGTNMSDDRVSRVIAARISVWLELLLSGQHILIDAPHLHDRLSGVIGNVDIKADPYQLSKFLGQGEEYELIRDDGKWVYQLSHWLDRKVWLWPGIEREDWDELYAASATEDSGLHFCEDLSAFYRKDELDAFRADVSTPYPIRYVKNHLQAYSNKQPIPVNYSPSVRLLS